VGTALSIRQEEGSVVAYDPSARVEIKTWDVEYRRNPIRTLLARIYQPQSGGPFPVLLDVHGGAWNAQDRTANELMDRGLAESGILVVAIDVLWASEAPYPASVQDASFGVRWLKAHAAEWGGDPATVGILGGSSGGHVSELIALRPHDPRYNAHVLPEAPALDATVAYCVVRSPVSDPYARYLQAHRTGREIHIKNSKIYFRPWDAIFEGNPQFILERGERVALPPMFILQGGLDDNVIPEIQHRFVASYRAAGGEIELEVFMESEHRWIIEPTPATQRAIDMIKDFVARQVGAGQPAAR
jgi:acetyl esterase/lipase